MKDWILTWLVETWDILLEMSPYLLLGFILAGLLSIVVRQELIERWLGKRSFGSVVKASLLGVPLPLCSCGVIPVTSSLYQRGASKGATTSFLTSTPQTGVDSILATAGLIGPFFAWFRVAVALASGIIAGLIVDLLDKEAPKTNSIESQAPVTDTRHAGEKFRAIFTYGFYTLPQEIGKTLVLGIILAGLLGAVLPENWGENYLSNPWLTYLAVTMIAIPLYVCSTGSIPIAFALLASGVSPGAALVFLIAGPATNVATITTLYKMLGRRTIFIYLLSIIGISWLSGWLLDIYGGTLIRETMAHHEMSGEFSRIKFISAISLLGMSTWTYLHPKLAQKKIQTTMTDSDTITLKIEGMTCSHCANHVKQALEGISGIRSAKADANQNLAWVEGQDINLSQVSQAVEEAGYEFKGTN